MLTGTDLIYLENSEKKTARFEDDNQQQLAICNEKYTELSKVDSLAIMDPIDSIKSSSKRLAIIKNALDEPEQDFFSLVSKSDLKKNLDFVIQVLENVLNDERKYIFNVFAFDLHAEVYIF